MARGSFQLSLANCTDVAQPRVCKYLRIVAKAIADLAPEFISFPEPEQEQGTMNEFFSIARIPGVIGCTDGCHVPIQNPGGQNPELYRCRKGWMSINVMAVCDASLKSTDLVVGWPGSALASLIFTSSALYDRLESGVHQGFLLGDINFGKRGFRNWDLELEKVWREVKGEVLEQHAVLVMSGH
nr:putative nuclease HARBI1 [Penaeus vannamei]